MAHQVIAVDTSVLIDFYRKKNKQNSAFYKLGEKYSSFAVSAVTWFEIYVGGGVSSKDYWDEFFSELTILPFTTTCAEIAVNISHHLKRRNKAIDTPDLFIAATAIANDLPLATLNAKHFSRIEQLVLIRD
jgi:tRNA(fMet)-specific endonuclease VapC